MKKTHLLQEKKEKKMRKVLLYVVNRTMFSQHLIKKREDTFEKFATY